MYISEQNRFIFFHNGKCAGTTISSYFGGLNKCFSTTKQFLDRYCVDEYKNESGMFDIRKYVSPAAYDSYERQNPGMEGMIFVQHFTFRDLDRILQPDSGWKQFFKFCFVRNPYSHFYSYFLQMISSAARIPAGMKGKPDFESYIFHPEGGAKYMKNISLSAYTHVGDLPVVDYVGKVENFDEEMRGLKDRIFIEYSPIRLNRKGDGEYLKHYTARTIAHVNALYGQDFARFGYQKIDPASFQAG